MKQNAFLTKTRYKRNSKLTASYFHGLTLNKVQRKFKRIRKYLRKPLPVKSIYIDLWFLPNFLCLSCIRLYKDVNYFLSLSNLLFKKLLKYKHLYRLSRSFLCSQHNGDCVTASKDHIYVRFTDLWASHVCLLIIYYYVFIIYYNVFMSL